MKGLTIEAVIGLVGAAVVITGSNALTPVRIWFQTRAHVFWGWVHDVISDSMWVGWWIGFWWGLYSDNRIFESVLWGGLVCVCAYAADEFLAMANTGSRLLVRRFVSPPQPQPKPSPRSPYSADLTEEQAHEIMDAHDEKEP